MPHLRIDFRRVSAATLVLAVTLTGCSFGGSSGGDGAEEDLPRGPVPVSDPLEIPDAEESQFVLPLATDSTGDIVYLAGPADPEHDSAFAVRLWAMDTDGGVLWSRDDLDVSHFSQSPEVDPVLLLVPELAQPDITALDPGTGEQVWSLGSDVYTAANSYVSDSLMYRIRTHPNDRDRFLLIGTGPASYGEYVGEDGRTTPIGSIAEVSAATGEILWDTSSGGSLAVTEYAPIGDGSYWLAVGVTEDGVPFVAHIDTSTGYFSDVYPGGATYDLFNTEPVERVRDLEPLSNDRFALTVNGTRHTFEAESWGPTGEGQAGGMFDVVESEPVEPVSVETVLPGAQEVGRIGDTDIRLAATGDLAQGAIASTVGAVDAGGELLWEQLQEADWPFHVASTRPEGPYWLDNTHYQSPAPGGGPILGHTNPDTGSYRVLDLESGAELWSTGEGPYDLRFNAAWSTAGMTLMTVPGPEGARRVGVDIRTGEEHFSYPLAGGPEQFTWPGLLTLGRFAVLHDGGNTLLLVAHP